MLCNYVKRIVLPVLRLNGTYQEDENVEEKDPTSAPSTHKQALDLGESVIPGTVAQKTVPVFSHSSKI